MRECNGAPLMIQVMTSLDLYTSSDSISQMLTEPAPAFYIFLSQATRAKYDRGTVNVSSQTPRWQNLDPPLWRTNIDTPAVLTYVLFVTQQLCIIGTHKKEDDRANARQLLCSNTARKREGQWNEWELEVLKLGAVRGTFGIQLSAYVLVTPPENSNHATIEKGKSGYYKCVNLHLKNKCSGKNLSTGQARRRRLLGASDR